MAFQSSMLSMKNAFFFFFCDYWLRYLRLSICKYIGPRTTDTQWRHKSKKSESLGRCGRQNMLRLYLQIWDRDLFWAEQLRQFPLWVSVVHVYIYICINTCLLFTLRCQINESTRLSFLDFSPPWLQFFHPTWLLSKFSILQSCAK